jgi:hypothetical protein
MVLKGLIRFLRAPKGLIRPYKVPKEAYNVPKVAAL